MTSAFDRRRFLEAAVSATAIGFSGCVEAPSRPVKYAASVSEIPEEVALEPVATGFGFPTDVAFAPDADRRYIAERPGLVHVHESGTLLDKPFLDIRDAVDARGEMGFLGIELHPAFAENRRLFVRYSAPPRPGTPADFNHTFVLAELEATEDGRRAKPESERAILEIPEPVGNHNAGDLAFGPDGYLYVPTGDGGRPLDRGPGHARDWYEVNGGGNGQDVTENLLGSILRIDVNQTPTESDAAHQKPSASEDVDESTGDRRYGIPEDNPLVGQEGLDEHYAWGFRNPWRMSFDGDDLFVGDVGERIREEINLVEKGGNYGWNVKEGTTCVNGENPEAPLDECPDSTPDDVRGGEPLVDPIVEYSNLEEPAAVICGYVYRGAAISSLVGVFVFGDLYAQGTLMAATPSEDDGMWSTKTIDIVDEDADRLQLLLSFGRDPSGELYVLGRGGEVGGLYRLTPAG